MEIAVSVDGTEAATSLKDLAKNLKKVRRRTTGGKPPDRRGSERPIGGGGDAKKNSSKQKHAGLDGNDAYLPIKRMKTSYGLPARRKKTLHNQFCEIKELDKDSQGDSSSFSRGITEDVEEVADENFRRGS